MAKLQTPVPTIDKDIKDIFWKSENWDKYVPKDGFINDFVYATRGIRTPTKFCLWTAIFMISAVLKRHAWLKWNPGKFYANLFVFFVAPPAICGKSTAVKQWADERIFQGYEEFIKDPSFRNEKRLKILRSKATEAAIFQFLKPSSQMCKTGKKMYRINSDGVFIVSELATFLGKQQYNVGLVERLISLYDCAKSDDSNTIRGGTESLKDIYVCMLAATTKTGLAESIPETAYSDGFLSRVIILSQDVPTRIYPFPQSVVGAKSFVDLQKALAWIATNAVGEYTFSPEALKAYTAWYTKFMEECIRKQDGTEYRKDTHILKLSLLLRAQRYKEGTTIELEDFLKAQQLLNAMCRDTGQALEEVGLDFVSKMRTTVSSWIEVRKQVTRKDVLHAFSGRKVTSKMMNLIIEELIAQSAVKVKRDNKYYPYPSKDTSEIYEWIKIEN